MDKQTQKTVKNILHNELGITSEKVEILITDYINKKLNERIETFLGSNQFTHMVNKRIEDQIYPLIRTNLRDQLAGISINVTLANKKPK